MNNTPDKYKKLFSADILNTSFYRLALRNPNYFNETDAVDFHIKAGSLVFFNQHIVHGSGPNLSDQQRRAYIITYQPKDQPMLKSGVVNNIN